ncbi:MAG: D-tyrosyl-tRNA(Tyr) deacylase [Saprospirales bacterium]|nr:MAG: D-tyrosyl-tRNA(Tyr) deacylase [Saprospirales bacterium]
MRAVIQRAEDVRVKVLKEGVLESRGEFSAGLVVLVGFEKEDGEEDMDYLLRKIPAMRIFNDEDGKMNLSVEDIRGGIAVVSQFTLYACTKKGNRPSFIRACEPNKAKALYDEFVMLIRTKVDKVVTGEFGAYMKIDFVNEGPVTIIIDSKNREF